MRWDYTEPERKQFVSDGTKIYFYIPADKQVIVSPVPADAEATTPALFLAGKGRLTTRLHAFPHRAARRDCRPAAWR